MQRYGGAHGSCLDYALTQGRSGCAIA
jgi:hypothetical protein